MQQPMQQVQQSIQHTMQQQQQQQQEQNMAMQQMQQQMMLCPVRVVYETQILVQPGDQIQPNQTLFINPQNPPPWAQNRQPVQNQVIYVQQMPNNLISTVPQHIDQNQLYLQHYQNYQQMIPQQLLAQNQEQRQIQLPNVMQQNVLQNFQTNFAGNIPNLPDRISQTSFQAIPNITQTVQMPTQQQQQHTVPNTNNINRTETNMQIAQQPPQPNQNPRPEIRPVYINQPNQQQIRPTPQILTVNPIQNVPQTNYQPIPMNSIPRSIQTQSVGSQMSPPTFANAQPRIRKVAPTTVNKVTNTNMGVRNMGQTYRPIQPRPQQFRNTAPNFPNSIEIQAQPNKPMQVGSNIININPTLPSMPSLQPTAPNSTITFVRPEDQTNFRKRKSESPDEIHKKMAAIQVNITTPIKPVTIPQRNIEYMPNMNSVKMEQKPNITIVPQPLIPNTTEVPIPPVEVKEISKLVENVQQAIQVDKSNVKTNPDVKDTAVAVSDKDKLIRNTVFTQARGRVLSDKEGGNVLKDTKNILKIEPEAKTPIEIKQENVEPPKIITEEVKVEHKVEKIENDTSITLKTPNNKGMLPVDRSTKQERDFVLTHVLDGIVIQESNVAFPIRDPATRRIVQPMKQDCKPTIDPKEEITSKEGDRENKTVSKTKEMSLQNEMKVKSEEKTDVKGAQVDSEVKTEAGNSSEETDKAENPFQNLQPATVKSWTIEKLSSHLSKFKWTETAALLLEHEIDGESIFLVSKTLLLNIGVKENHADFICSYINS